MSEPILEAVDLRKTYGKGHTLVNVLRGASLAFEAGELLAVVGPSGSGKSTLLHILGGLDAADAGDVLYRGEPISKMWGGRLDVVRNMVFGFVFQFYHLLGEFTALENVLMPQMIRSGPLGWLKKGREARREAAGLLERLGLGERLAHRPSELSGGEQQRVAIARALAGDPEILLCDEPTGNLDSRTSGEIIDLLLELNGEGRTMVVVTHDPALAAMAHRRLEIREGRIRSAS
jgi:lipoprotein-releasing system ATP-binding protein